ncbi:hypothetical protein [Thalassobacillus sp. C254]|uniref:hypothetical protein n=1 Tax=Thalassobacillus sp. C254 TaxID=1225341 RepID=UPI0006D09FED|nr:hypothetical protein [Thalassobacillus sp. C254]
MKETKEVIEVSPSLTTIALSKAAAGKSIDSMEAIIIVISLRKKAQTFNHSRQLTQLADRIEEKKISHQMKYHPLHAKAI